MPGDITRLLIACGDGDADAFRALVEVVYQDLRRMGRTQLRGDRIHETLNTTALVHELYLKLPDLTRLSLRDRHHFFAVAARAMRHIIVDFARERLAAKRGGGQVQVPLDEADAMAKTEATRILALHDALEQLERADRGLARVVDCLHFAGYTEQETAEVLGMSLRSVQRA